MAAFKKVPFASSTGAALYRHIWQPEGEIRGILQLTHGMAEHIARYDGLAGFLAEKGFLVVGHNHLGHGDEAARQGFFAGKNGWDALLNDMHKVREDTQKEYPGVPYFLLGHSMGSFLVRCYLQTRSTGLKGAVISGTGAIGADAFQIADAAGPGRPPCKDRGYAGLFVQQQALCPRQNAL